MTRATPSNPRRAAPTVMSGAQRHATVQLPAPLRRGQALRGAAPAMSRPSRTRSTVPTNYGRLLEDAVARTFAHPCRRAAS